MTNPTQNPANPSQATTEPNAFQLNELIAAFNVIQDASLQTFRTLSGVRNLPAFIRKLDAFIDRVDDIRSGLYSDQWNDEDEDYEPIFTPNMPATNKTKEVLIDNINKAFDNLCAAVEFNRELGLTFEHLGYVISDAEQLIVRLDRLRITYNLKQFEICEFPFSLKPLPNRRQELYQALRQSTPPKPKAEPNPPPHRRSLDDILREQAQQRGLEPLPLEPELLLKRIADGGHSGQFLADAFISAYRTSVPFPHSLGELHKLDAEAFRLFHEILHIRHIRGWSDDDLYQLEQQVVALVGGGQ